MTTMHCLQNYNMVNSNINIQYLTFNNVGKPKKIIYKIL